MNKTYKSVWNESLGVWVAASETAKGRSKKGSVKTNAAHGISIIALTGAGLGIASASADAAIYNAALFNDFTDGECTAVQDGSAGGVSGHTLAGATTAGCSAKIGTGASATSIGLNGGGAGTNGTNFISNQNGAFVNGGLEVFGENGAAGAPVAYVHGSMSLFSDGTTAGTASKLIGLAAGTAGTDAVNVGQLTPVVSALGGGASVAADGSVTGPTYTIKGTNYNTVGAALTALGDSSGSGSSKYFHANSTLADSTATGNNSVAIGPLSTALGNNTTALGYKAVSSGDNESIAIGAEVSSTVSDAVSIGSQIKNDAISSVVIGSNYLSLDKSSTSSVLLAPNGGNVVNSANSLSFNPYGNATSDSPTNTSDSNDSINLSGTAAGAAGGVTIGSKSSVTAANAVAVGASASASATGAAALGSGSVADRENTVSFGNSSIQRQLVQVAKGTQATDAVNLSQLTPVTTALGGGAAVATDGSVTAPTYTIKGTNYNNVGAALSALAESSGSNKYLSALDADGSTDGATATGMGSIAIGGDAVATNDKTDAAIAIGSHSRAATRATALGPSATASAFDSVALGSESVSDRAGTVSVGNATTKRQVVNVAAGTQATDAVNVTQLQSVTSLLGGGATVNPDGSIKAPAYTVAGTTLGTVGDAIAKVDTELNNKVAYDSSAKTQVTLGGAGTSTPVTLTNVKAGALSSTSVDAVNGSQLFATNTRVGSLETFETNINNGSGIKYFHTNSQLADSVATGTDSVAIGGAAKASANNAVALGSNSVADRTNSVSVGAAGSERQITNVAAGTATTDAVNLGQLTATNSNLNQLSTFAVKYDSNANGTPNTDSVTLGGLGAPNATKISNLANGNLSSASTDAVNGSQLFATNTRVGSLETFETAINNGGGIKYFHANSSQVDSSATGAETVAIGGGAKATANNSVALGSNSIADRKDSVSVGAAGGERQIINVAAGTSATDAVNFGQLTATNAGLNQLSTFAVKYDSNADGTPNTDSITLGGPGAPNATKISNLANGNLSSASTDAVNGSQLFATNTRVGSLEAFETNINNGGGIKYFHTNSQLADSTATGTNSVAIGGAANALANNAVALGSNSVADRANSVSVGAAGNERQITNVAAGTSATDAVNFGQLTSVSDNLSTLDNFAVKYDKNTDGSANYQRVTLGGADASSPTLLTNVAKGALNEDSTDAVNGSQLYATNQDVAALQSFTNNINNGGGIKYFHSNSTLADSSATGADAVAIGGAAVASAKNSVALGANSMADRDNSVSVGAAGSERQITNVAAGTQDTDAANVGQLNAVSQTVTSLGASAIKYDTNADGTPDYANATLGNGNATGTALHNVAAGTSSMDAVNLGQIDDMIGQVTNLANGAYNPMFSADGNRDTEAATSSGTHSVAAGANAVASGANAVASGASSLASGANAVAVGANASATGDNALASGASSVASGTSAVAVGANTSATGINALASGTAAVASGMNAVAVGKSSSANADNGVAVGANASATANNAVALGTGSVADRDNSVSVGSAGSERQITNVAAGVNRTDAVNMGQLQGVQQSVNSLSRTAYSGIAMAGALAGLPQVEAGKTFQVSAGAGAYANYAALAVGASARLTQNTIVKLGASATNGSHVLVNAGLGYSW